jgi:hypothetical protein
MGRCFACRHQVNIATAAATEALVGAGPNIQALFAASIEAAFDPEISAPFCANVLPGTDR